MLCSARADRGETIQSLGGCAKCAFPEGDLFLDDRSLEEAEQRLGVSIRPVGGDAQSLLDALLGEN